MASRASIAVLCLMFVLAFNGVDDAWRRANDRGNRYEGTAIEKVAASPVAELIGFHAYRQDFDPTSDIRLQVRFYANAAKPTARITAREYDRKEFYWMEAKPQPWKRGWNTFGPWPVRGVLSSLGIGSGNLVVLIRLDRFITGGGMVAPAFITAAGVPIATREYHAYFLPGKGLDKVDYELRRGNSVVVRGSLEHLPSQVPFTIPLSVRGVTAGPMQLELKCRVAGESGPAASLVYTFVHQPESPAAK